MLISENLYILLNLFISCCPLSLLKLYISVPIETYFRIIHEVVKKEIYIYVNR